MCIFLVNLSTDSSNKLQIYLDYFEKAYLETTKEFYVSQAQQYLADNGVQSYMKYVRLKTCMLVSNLCTCTYMYEKDVNGVKDMYIYYSYMLCVIDFEET